MFICLCFIAFAVTKRWGDHAGHIKWGIHPKEKEVVGASPREEFGHHCCCTGEDDDRCRALYISTRCWLFVYHRLPTTWWCGHFRTWLRFMHVHARSWALCESNILLELELSLVFSAWRCSAKLICDVNSNFIILSYVNCL